ncbi:hypothetical protein XELAEV_18012260mg [Xenopus laevis]|uniref:Uncharacterized protein n=1 Tax=Xenopus laevis TaxID=8355 RepID=A0A974DMA3_XENLA|nr:hypothetical protein XELAEV_18012260mg [Xenopus laevis]
MSSRQKRQHNQKRIALEQQLKQLQSKNKNSPSRKRSKQITEIKEELHQLDLQKMELCLRKLKIRSYYKINKIGEVLAKQLKIFK